MTEALDKRLAREGIFTVYCVHVGREVTLYKDTWYHKITKDHPEVSGKIALVKETLEREDETISKYKKKRNEREIAIYRECFHFLPYYRYLKIGLKILNEKKAVVTTAHGQHSVPPKDMERI